MITFPANVISSGTVTFDQVAYGSLQANHLTLEDMITIHHGLVPDDANHMFRYVDSLANGMINCFAYEIIKRTPCGVRIVTGRQHEDPKKGSYVHIGAGARFAYPNRKLAWDSFMIRKRRQLEYLSRDYQKLSALIEIAEMEDVR